ncbi:MAG: TRAP transporter substrate-binding protein [Betaproteobacteria bacterium]|nr:TRAP transporter substrate-binding protein [Betaproteobacteria bacterium]
MKRAIAILAGTLLCWAAPAAAQQKPIEWRMQTAFAATSPAQKYLERFRDEIGKRSNGRLVIKLFPNFGLGYKMADPLNAVRDGLMEAGHDNLNAYTGVVPLFALGNLPFLFDDDKDHLRGLGAARPFYEREFGKHNAKMLWLSAFPLTYVFARKPVLKVEDFKGMKIRVAAKPVMSAISKLGASPQTIALAEAITAMQTGVIDGQIWAIEAGITFKIQDVVHHGSAWPFYGVEQAIYVSKRKFDELPPDLQKIVMEVARENERQFTEDILLGDEQSRKVMEATGKMKFYSPDRKEIAKARAVSRSIWDESIKQIGPLGAEFIAAVEKALGR